MPHCTALLDLGKPTCAFILYLGGLRACVETKKTVALVAVLGKRYLETLTLEPDQQVVKTLVVARGPKVLENPVPSFNRVGNPRFYCWGRGSKKLRGWPGHVILSNDSYLSDSDY
jgi:hypothetical protein